MDAVDMRCSLWSGILSLLLSDKKSARRLPLYQEIVHVRLQCTDLQVQLGQGWLSGVQLWFGCRTILNRLHFITPGE